MKKKWLIIGAILITVLIVVLAGVFVGRPEKAPTPTPGKPAVGGTIKLPNGSKVDVVFTGPPELEILWKKLEMLNGEIHPVGVIKNITTDQTVQFELAFMLDGVQKAKWPQLGNITLKPGEKTVEFAIGLLWEENSKLLEVKVVGFQKTGGSPVAPTQTPPPTQTPTPQPPPTPTKLAYKTNPVTPVEVVEAFIGFILDGKHTEAEKLLGPKSKAAFQNGGGLKNYLENYPDELANLKAIYRVEPDDVYSVENGSKKLDLNGDYADVAVYSIENGKEEKGYFYLQKINGVWKIK